MNSRSPADPRLAKLSLPQKVSLLSGLDEWTTKAIESAGIDSVWVSDGPHGLRKSPDSATGGYGDQFPATCFPTASALAATWDTKLIHTVAGYLAEECKAHNVDVLLGPGINIKRSPTGGRNFEYFSEDSIVSGEMGAAYINGLQQRGVGTSLKHFAANAQETKRMVVSSDMDQRTLRETYLTGFEIAVKKSQPWTIMAAYNPVNGVDATSNKTLLVDILREEWRYEGLVISDWVAVHDRVAAVKARMAVEMPGNGGVYDQQVLDAVADGVLSEAEIDLCVSDLLSLVDKAVSNRSNVHSFDAAKSHAFAREVAAQTLVLLKNDYQTLPLTSDKYQSIALIGEFAAKPRSQGNGSSEVKPTQLDNLQTELSALIGDSMTLTYSAGYSTEADEDTQYIEEAAQQAAKADVAVVHVGLPNHYESEGVDRTHIDLPPAQVELIKAVAAVQKHTVVVLTNGAAISMPWRDEVPAILETWLTGQAGGGAIADVLTGKVNPGGKLTETFPVRFEDTPAFLDYPSQSRSLSFGEGIYVGYKWYDKRKITPLFPFGYGLSYTQFQYEHAQVSKTQFSDTDSLEVTVQIRNTGPVSGSEVVQLYVAAPQDGRTDRPVKELKAFGKIELAPDEVGSLTLTLNPRDFAYFDTDYDQWVIESGNYQLLIASNAQEVQHCLDVELNSTQTLPVRFDRRTTLKEFTKHDVTRDIAYRLVKDFFEPMPGLFAGPLIDFKIHNGFFMDMPIHKYAMLSRGKISYDRIDAAIAEANTHLIVV